MNGVAVAVAIGVPRLVPVMCSVPEGHRDCGRQGVRVHPRSFPATPSAERGGGGADRAKGRAPRGAQEGTGQTTTWQGPLLASVPSGTFRPPSTLKAHTTLSPVRPQQPHSHLSVPGGTHHVPGGRLRRPRRGGPINMQSATDKALVRCDLFTVLTAPPKPRAD